MDELPKFTEWSACAKCGHEFSEFKYVQEKNYYFCGEAFKDLPYMMRKCLRCKHVWGMETKDARQVGKE